MSARSTKSNSTYFLALRKRLDSLGYTDLPLGLDSAPLVQQMVEDIIATTETLKETEETLEKQKSENTLLQAQIEPLQEENVRLTRENTQLHQLLIKSKEDLVKQDNQNSMNAFELNAENRRLKLVYQKSQDQIKELEKKLEQTNTKLKEALETPSVTTISEITDSQSRRTKRSARSRRPGYGLDGQSVISAIDDSELIAAKQEIEKLKNDLAEKEKEIQLYNSKLSESSDILKIKDDEIVRIGAELQRETGKNGYIISLRHKYAQQEVEIEKLRAQLRVSGAGRSAQRIRRFVRTAPKTTIAINLATSEDLRNMSSASGFPDSFSIKSEKTDNEYNEEKEPANIKSVSSTPEKEERLQSAHDEADAQQAVSVAPGQAQGSNPQVVMKLQSKIEKKKQAIALLKNEIRNRDKIIIQKDQRISEMAASFAYIGDNLQAMESEKEQVISQLKARIAQIESNRQNEQEKEKQQNEQEKSIAALMKQFEATRNDYEKKINSKKQKIQLLKDKIIELSKPKELPPCAECAKLKIQIEELQKQLAANQKENEDIEAIKANAKQLEKLLRAADEERDLHADDAEKVVKLQKSISILESENDDIKNQLNKKEVELEKMKQLLEESESRSNSVPDIQQRARIAVEQAKSEAAALQSELVTTKANLKDINSRYIECQKLNRKFQQQAQEALQEAALKKEEAKFHRTKNEEIQSIATAKIQKIQEEMTTSVSQLTHQLQEKTKEAELLQKLLLKTRSEIAPLSEVQIPQLQAEIAKMEREKQELANRVRTLCELAQFTEKTTEFSPNSLAFIQALHKFNDQMSPFTTSQ